jgi:hypothetical protein
MRYHALPFSPEWTYKVLRDGLLANGHTYVAGEIFDKSAVPERTLMGLYERRWITPVVEGTTEPAAAVAAQVAEPAPVAAVEPAPVEPVAEPAPEPAAPVEQKPERAMVHKGFGKYNVEDADGNVIATGLSKEEAQAMVG